MKNQLTPGNTVDVTAPYNVASGGGCLVGSLFGIAGYTALSGATVTLSLEGTYSITKNSAEAWTVGQLIYWDNTNFRCTTTATSNKLIGVAVNVAANPSSTGNVRLNNAFIS